MAKDTEKVGPYQLFMLSLCIYVQGAMDKSVVRPARGLA